VRKVYSISIELNGHRFNQCIIDPHYQKKHREIDDDLILALLKTLDGRMIEADAISNDGSEYYVIDPAYFDGKPYRLVLFITLEEEFIGVINCFRRPIK